ncbi:Putative ATP-dependent RNA helicase DHX57 [Eumeta japonica]|uniref:ATP-dependent RNA helicase DHX57 n=1 Tax=Eumeta variegata TaxID=151549 RepID=A0A4C1ZN42_EUMVA|nr:Putative ATP-dependent RNA helicase DHX57 [Eumeta japonica]
MDSISKKLAEDIFLREPADARIRQQKNEIKEEPSTLRVEMQTLRLNPDSQKLVLDTLRFLHGPQFKLSSASVYKDKGSNLGNRYWMERGNLIVQGGCDYSVVQKQNIETSATRLRNFALMKLERYNFHKTHCAEALDVAGEDIDKALEILFYKYFEINPENKPEDIHSPKELLETRIDEKAVLESIYDESFQVKQDNVIVISGETGCGKSTQVPQYILDDWLENFSKTTGKDHVDIICTQPRRISAIGVADRVAEERVEKTGQIIGYQIRLENKISIKTRLTFCTTGILLRRLEYDPTLASITHILVDEVHERSEESDFLLLILRDLIKVRKDLTVILMSATLNAELFSEYFGKIPILEIPVQQFFLEEIMEMTNFIVEPNGQFARKIKKGDKDKINDLETELETCDLKAESNEPPKVTIPDENLSVAQVVARYPKCSKSTCKNMYLMDMEKINLELIEHVLMYIVHGDHKWPKEGAILIFLPGIAEIMSLYDQLSESHTFSPKTGNYMLVPLHSTLSSEEQSLVFSKPRNGARKIVLSTNIAETSVTIDDCVFVIDSGRMKEKQSEGVPGGAIQTGRERSQEPRRDSYY